MGAPNTCRLPQERDDAGCMWSSGEGWEGEAATANVTWFLQYQLQGGKLCKTSLTASLQTQIIKHRACLSLQSQVKSLSPTTLYVTFLCVAGRGQARFCLSVLHLLTPQPWSDLGTTCSSSTFRPYLELHLFRNAHPVTTKVCPPCPLPMSLLVISSLLFSS